MKQAHLSATSAGTGPDQKGDVSLAEQNRFYLFWVLWWPLLAGSESHKSHSLGQTSWKTGRTPKSGSRLAYLPSLSVEVQMRSAMDDS